MADRPSLRKMSAGVILVDGSGRVLLQLRDADASIMYPSHWGITGGASRPGETPEQTARREVAEETGLTLGSIEPFRAYYSCDAPAPGTGGRGRKRPTEYEVYLFHAECDTPAQEMVCGEGRELRFFAPEELAGLDLAYNHRDVLDDFVASAAYARQRNGTQSEIGHVDPLESFLHDLRSGDPWFDSLMRAIASWDRPGETSGGRRYDYLIGGEAFDWLLLAERLVEEAREHISVDEAERLLFNGRVPASDRQSGEHEVMSDDRLRGLIGETKYRAHLNFLYGVTVEEALQYVTELEIDKERVSALRDHRVDEYQVDPVFQRVYGRPRAELLREFRSEPRSSGDGHIRLSELREFTYWLFKYRVKTCEPARVASDTRKALAQLSAMELATRGKRQAVAPTRV